MPLRLEDKKALVSEVNAVATESLSALAAEYRGLSVAELTEFRRSARDQGVWVKVVKNTLAKRALTGTEYECLNDSLQGPLLLAFSQEDPGGAARVAKDFVKEHEQFVVKSLAVGGELLPASDLDRLASLPNREQALAMLLGVMKAPIEKFVRTLAEPPAKLARVLTAVKQQKEA